VARDGNARAPAASLSPTIKPRGHAGKAHAMIKCSRGFRARQARTSPSVLPAASDNPERDAFPVSPPTTFRE